MLPPLGRQQRNKEIVGWTFHSLCTIAQLNAHKGADEIYRSPGTGEINKEVLERLSQFCFRQTLFLLNILNILSSKHFYHLNAKLMNTNLVSSLAGLCQNRIKLKVKLLLPTAHMRWNDNWITSSKWRSDYLVWTPCSPIPWRQKLTRLKLNERLLDQLNGSFDAVLRWEQMCS